MGCIEFMCKHSLKDNIWLFIHVCPVRLALTEKKKLILHFKDNAFI